MNISFLDDFLFTLFIFELFCQVLTITGKHAALYWLDKRILAILLPFFVYCWIVNIKTCSFLEIDKETFSSPFSKQDTFKRGTKTSTNIHRLRKSHLQFGCFNAATRLNLLRSAEKHTCQAHNRSFAFSMSSHNDVVMKIADKMERLVNVPIGFRPQNFARAVKKRGRVHELLQWIWLEMCSVCACARCNKYLINYTPLKGPTEECNITKFSAYRNLLFLESWDWKKFYHANTNTHTHTQGEKLASRSNYFSHCNHLDGRDPIARWPYNTQITHIPSTHTIQTAPNLTNSKRMFFCRPISNWNLHCHNSNASLWKF